MKKTLFAALALVAMASCSNEEVLEMAQKEAIAFNNAFVNNSTRSVAAGYTNDKLFADFTVNGFVATTELFNNDKVYVPNADANTPITKDNATWIYDDIQYWIPDALYSFCALAPHTDGGYSNLTTTIGTPVENKKSLTTRFDFVNDGTIDLLYDEANCVKGQNTGNQPVAFNFRHLLSKVKFSFKNSYNATNSKIKVTDIKITNAHSKASATLTAENTNWVLSSDDAKITLNFDDATDLEGNELIETEAPEKGYESGKTYESKYEMLLIPSSTEYEYKVEFVVELYINDEKIATYYHTGDHAATVKFAPAAATSYNITAEITPNNIDDDPTAVQQPIQFTVTNVGEWTTGNATVTFPE